MSTYISRNTKPIPGMFIIIWMHLSRWLQKYSWNSKNLRFLRFHILQMLDISSAHVSLMQSVPGMADSASEPGIRCTLYLQHFTPFFSSLIYIYWKYSRSIPISSNYSVFNYGLPNDLSVTAPLGMRLEAKASVQCISHRAQTYVLITRWPEQCCLMKQLLEGLSRTLTTVLPPTAKRREDRRHCWVNGLCWSTQIEWWVGRGQFY